ncbi:hypothetical protein Z043_114769 [Scleropages formosus]|uniref:Uncharacterized protein n=1 Tax=Scleropages formosus TaxID=113540 RepID=A0A0P7UFC9_SCLFO|nr:hypothetical protein Z043_114769 [Scleropages formosus]
MAVAGACMPSARKAMVNIFPSGHHKLTVGEQGTALLRMPVSTCTLACRLLVAQEFSCEAGNGRGALTVGLVRQCQTIHGRDRTCIPPRLPPEWVTTLFFIILGIVSLTVTCGLLVASHWRREATKYARWIAFTGSEQLTLRQPDTGGRQGSLWPSAVPHERASLCCPSPLTQSPVEAGSSRCVPDVTDTPAPPGVRLEASMQPIGGARDEWETFAPHAGLAEVTFVDKSEEMPSERLQKARFQIRASYLTTPLTGEDFGDD